MLRAAFGTGSACTRDRNFAFQTGFSYVDCSPVQTPVTCTVTSFPGVGHPPQCLGIATVIVETEFIPRYAFGAGMGTMKKVTIGNVVETIDTGAFGFVDTAGGHNYYHDSAIEEVVFQVGRDPAVSLVIQDRAFALSRALRRLNLSDLYTPAATGHIGVQLGEYVFWLGMTSANLGDVV